MKIDHFISLVKKRITGALFIKNIGPTTLAISTVLLLQSLAYVLEGNKVDIENFTYPVVGIFIFYLVYTWTKIPSKIDAARFADKFFRMKDSLISQIDLISSIKP